MGRAGAVWHLFPGHLLRLITGLSLTGSHTAPQAQPQASRHVPRVPGAACLVTHEGGLSGVCAG